MDLSATIRRNITKIPHDIDLIVGVPRSGLFPSLIASTYLNVPVTSLDLFLKKELPTVGFYRSPKKKIKNFDEVKKVLILDDSICSGKSLEKVKRDVDSHLISNIEIIYGAVYFVKEAVHLVDIVMEEVSLPRFFQWNIFSHGYFLSRACVDIDGVVCDDPSAEDNDDGERYKAFIENAKPRIHTAEGNVISCFVTSRLEKYRTETEAWLNKYYKFDSLIMLNLPSKEERIRLNMYAKFKADVYKKRDEFLFIESDFNQAVEIARLSQKPVLCTDTMDFIHRENLHLFEPHCKKDIGFFDINRGKKEIEYSKIKSYIRKSVKFALPYFIVRLYQKYTRLKSLTDCVPQEVVNDTPPLIFCPFCEKKSFFIPCGVDVVREHSACPVCGSMERDRALFYVYQVLFLTKQVSMNVLHLAPEACSFHLFLSKANINYRCMDLHPEKFPFASAYCEKQDALHTTYGDQTFDVIIANHLIEHIPEGKFLLEMNRIMRNDGVMILSMPVYWHEALTLEDERLVQTPEDRKRHFGQDDHIRKYGADVADRLSEIFEVQTIKAHDMRPLGDPLNTNIFILRKKNSG